MSVQQSDILPAGYHEAAARQGWQDAGDFNEPHDPSCFFVNNDGLRLCIGRWLPPTPEDVKACIVYIHGYGHHFHTLGGYFSKLAESGIATVALDQAGHGYVLLAAASSACDGNEGSICHTDIVWSPGP